MKTILLQAWALGIAVTATILVHHAGAATPQESIARVKQSVVAIGTVQPTRNPVFAFRGTGFVVGNGLLVATNNHVVPAILDSERYEQLAIAIPHGNNIETRLAERGPSDVAADLVLLRIKGSPLSPLSLGAPESVREGDNLLFTGFPIGPVLGLYPASHRAMVATLTPMAIPVDRANQLDPRVLRQLAAGPMEVFQLDGTAYPGSSGSPLYRPETGEVVGIINMVFVKGSKETALTEPSGISYAVPVRFLRELLSRVR